MVNVSRYIFYLAFPKFWSLRTLGSEFRINEMLKKDQTFWTLKSETSQCNSPLLKLKQKN